MAHMDIQTSATVRLPVHYEQESFKLVRNLLTAALLECCSPQEYSLISDTDMLEMVADQCHDDLLAFAAKDPAAGFDPVFIARTYTSYAAVLHYRLAHQIAQTCGNLAAYERSLAAIVSRRGKMLSGAEIHCHARIGARFIIDHGVGTVIGETSVIGDDCYILGGVTLGARGISQNPCGARHPRIGDRVQIGAFSSVLGPVHVGNDAFIGPGCIISKDVPARAKVHVKTALQMVLEQ
ncbi:serine O-acetyltransferase [Pseudomonas cremoricolorata]|uniref:serine O-acetyltransferase n=1 Tax=Pseudomonas cremoricolorata TaxID=157783 RepID=A0A089WPD4_9PSED|nr:serine O-acetyltransferase [Pseudomonas cremoricolorata]AIR90446.1 serine acetyltransferase [Pseudomonas cremoricolorata]